MRQKEVMGQSIRTSKSARPGTITYVPIDKSEFRSTVSSDKKEKQNYENSCNAYSDDFGYELLCVCRYILLLLISLLFGYDHQWN